MNLDDNAMMIPLKNFMLLLADKRLAEQAVTLTVVIMQIIPLRGTQFV